MPWPIRVVIGLVLGYVVFRLGTAMLFPLRTREKTYPPVDVVEPEGVPVYACASCGTQLVLLRRGSDKPPRHCGEAMEYAVVPDLPDIPDAPPADW